MGLMDWFKNLAAGTPGDEAASDAAPEGGLAQPAQAVAAAEEEGTVAGLNFKTAIDAHMKWKVRLEACMENDNQEGLLVDVVSRDDQCPLGKWIQGVGSQRFGHLREFQEMKMEHARFHLCAGDVLACCIAGDKEGAGQKLRSGDYSRASARVKLHLARLYVQVAEKH